MVVGRIHMKSPVEKREPYGFLDYLSLALSTWGVGYIPVASGTFGAAVGVIVYLLAATVNGAASRALLHRGYPNEQSVAFLTAANGLLLIAFSLLGIWASGRSIPLLGDLDPSESVVDEVIGQLVTLLFIPLGVPWQFILAGFLLFRLFDIWKPFPIDNLQSLPGGIGVCADDVLAGVYAGTLLALGYAIYLVV